MMTITLMMLLAASVTSVMVKNGLGTCLSYYGRTPGAVGRFVITSLCNSNDTKQTNWVVTPINTNSTSGTYTFCQNGTSLCSGLRAGIFGGYQLNLRLVTKNSASTAQLWSPTNSTALPNNYINGGTGRCAQAYNAYRQGGVINTVACRNIPAQQWTVV